MVIVRLTGGLANQMFPYAVGRRLAHLLETELKLDISGFDNYEKSTDLEFRRYALGVFNVCENFATQEEIRALTWREPSLLERLLRRKPKRPATFVKERQYHFDPTILRLTGNVYLAGNWNSYMYFADIENIIRSDFTFRQPPTGKNLEVFNHIGVVEAVSIHVRRGDYVTNARANQIHGTCDLDYYRASVEWLMQKIEKPHFFVFSDDPDWVRQHLQVPAPCTIVDCNGPLDGHEDLRLMSHCRHHVIANSGFSWWSAWLNSRPNKLVVAPRRWFRTDKYDTSTLIPASWIRL